MFSRALILHRFFPFMLFISTDVSSLPKLGLSRICCSLMYQSLPVLASDLPAEIEPPCGGLFFDKNNLRTIGLDPI
jgi:hypothetical protein